MEKWRKLRVVSNNIEADILCGYLDSCGIRVSTRSESIGMIHGLTVGPLAEVEILVPEDQFEEASRVLEEFDEDGDNDYSD